MISVNLRRKKKYPSSIWGFSAMVFLVALLISTLTGCGNLFKNTSDKTTLGEEDSLPDAGVPGVTTRMITPTGKDLAIFSVSSIQPMRTSTVHTSTNAISFQVAIQSEKGEYAAVHLREIGNSTAESGIYSLDSALGCHYSIGNPGTPRAHIATLSGSCVNTLVVELPDHEIPRAFLGTTPLFPGEIDLGDLKAVYAAAGYNPKIVELLQTYIGRLAVDVKPLTIADVGGFMLQLGNDPARIDAVAFLAPRVSDPSNADSLPKDVFTNEVGRARAVKILAAYR